MKKAIRTHAVDFAALLVLVVVAAVVGGYVLSNQRLRFPVIEAKPVKLKAEFSTAQAVTPGQGQTVRISGVRVGDVAKVQLKEGRAVITFDIDKEYLPLIRENATALLRPKTALKDMFVELDPGTAPARPVREGFTIPVENTLPDVNVDEVFAALDGDTRDYLKLLVNGAADGLKGRGDDLRRLFERFEPTHRDLARVNEKVAERSANLRRLISNLNTLNTELAGKDDELAQLVDSSARVFRAFASEGGNITETVDELPEALQQTTRTLVKVERFAEQLGPAAERLRPAVRAIDDANGSLERLAEEGTPILEQRIRPFVREVRPLVRDLRPASRRLAAGTPDLTRSFVILNRLFNLVGFNQGGREPADKATRDEGYLFWLAWLGHNGGALHSQADPNGIYRPVALAPTCNTLRSTIAEEPEIEFLQGLTGVLTDPRICPSS